MSKKIAAGADAIVLDVKVGDGAFMKTLEDARALARAMLELGRRRRPRGRLPAHRHGPAARRRRRQRARDRARRRDTVRGEGPPDFTELVLDACARLLALSDLGVDVEEGRRRAEAAVADGSALAVYERWIRAQGGDPDPRRSRARRSCSRSRRRATGTVTRLGAIARRHRGAPPRRRPPDEGGRDRPRGRRRLPCEARRECRGRRRPRRGARARRGERGGGGGGRARGVRARRRAAARARRSCSTSSRDGPPRAARGRS